MVRADTRCFVLLTHYKWFQDNFKGAVHKLRLRLVYVEGINEMMTQWGLRTLQSKKQCSPKTINVKYTQPLERCLYKCVGSYLILLRLQ